jgi:hypothetical protein
MTGPFFCYDVSMAKVIQFPAVFRDKPELDTDIQRQCKLALKMLLENIQSEKVEPSRMFIMYGDWNTGGLSYLNMGFPIDDLVKAIDQVIEDQKENPD